MKLRFREMLKTWSLVSLISMCDTELADNRNQMDVKIDPHQAYFFQNIRCSILTPWSILPRLIISSMRYVTINDVLHSYTRYIKTSRLRYPSISSNNTVYPILKQGFGLVTSNHRKMVDSGVSHQLSYQIHYQRHDNCEELNLRI